jgi:cyclophilin family peptidyl-prolyl cis-trans isomerase/HEAT repeat protein
MTKALGLGVLFLLAQSAQPLNPRQQGGEPDIVLQLEERWAGVDALMPLTTSMDPAVRHYALRALGRLRNPSAVPQLLAETTNDGAPLTDIAAAVARSLEGLDPHSDPKLVSQVADWMYTRANVSDPLRVSPYLMPLSRIAYATAGQTQRIEALLLHVLNETSSNQQLAAVYGEAADAAGWLARKNPTLERFDRSTVEFLDSMVASSHANDTAGPRFAALTALINGGAVDQDTERVALKDADAEVRRLALTVLGGSGGGLASDERISLARNAMNDPSGPVRYEALHAYVRRGGGAADCQPILDRFDDGDSHVALEAIDALAVACKDNPDATDWLTAEVHTPSAQGAWNRPAHAFVALATRAPDRAAPLMGAFVVHPQWWVRLYAVKAAVAMKDIARLESLALDDNDNVRAAALKPLKQLGSPNADEAILQALKRSDYELLLTAANLLKDAPPDEHVAGPLVSTLLRVTGEAKETSRDTRLALLDAIAVHGDAAAGAAIVPLAKDFDPRVAASAASIASRLTGRAVAPAPAAVSRGWPRRFQNLQQCVQVDLSSGRTFVMRMLPEGAPITVDRFLQLATVDHYYDGLTFHRVVPNFVVQGGSPGANEHSGAKDFMRDEIALTNSRGTVGLSTRGLNTGDAQFYINLVDNRRLDEDYTVFARVNAMEAVEQIEEGEQIVRINARGCPR